MQTGALAAFLLNLPSQAVRHNQSRMLYPFHSSLPTRSPLTSSSPLRFFSLAPSPLLTSDKSLGQDSRRPGMQDAYLEYSRFMVFF